MEYRHVRGQDPKHGGHIQRRTRCGGIVVTVPGTVRSRFQKRSRGQVFQGIWKNGHVRGGVECEEVALDKILRT